MRDFRHWIFNHKVCFGFNQIVSSRSSTARSRCSSVKSREIMSDRKDLIDPAFNSITNTSQSTLTFINFRFIDNSFVSFQFEFDFEKLMLIGLLTVNLFIQVVECEDYTLTDPISYNCVDIFGVFFPFRLFLVEFHSVIYLFQELVNDGSAIFNTDQLVCNDCFENVIVLLRRNGLILAINHGLF